jgi:hypothetical protein
MKVDLTSFPIYHGAWESKADIARAFDIPIEILEKCYIYFAGYNEGDYEGSCVIIFRKDGTLYYNAASHCSCNGFEGNWDPEEATWEDIKRWEKQGGYYNHEDCVSEHDFQCVLNAVIDYMVLKEQSQ